MSCHQTIHIGKLTVQKMRGESFENLTKLQQFSVFRFFFLDMQRVLFVWIAGTLIVNVIGP